MPQLREAPPYAAVEPVSEIMHGVSVTDPYRWLEEQDSARTREWLSRQSRYARACLDAIPGRKQIRARVSELLDVETYDSLRKVGNRYFFRKRLRGEEQPAIYCREGREGRDQLLIDPRERGTGPHTAVRLLRISPDGSLLLYEVKRGGERSGLFEIFDIASRRTLPDGLSRGYLRGFAFAPDSRGFYYVHEPLAKDERRHHAVYKHVLGCSRGSDQNIFSVGEENSVRLVIVPGTGQMGIIVVRLADDPLTDFYLWRFGNQIEPVLENAAYQFSPLLLSDGRILAVTNRDAPNSRIVEVLRQGGEEPRLVDLVPSCEWPIQSWTATTDRIFVTYVRHLQTEIDIFDFAGHRIGQVPTAPGGTARLLGCSDDGQEFFFEEESFTQAVQIRSYSGASCEATLWAERAVPFDSARFAFRQAWFPGKDGTAIPMFLVGRQDVLAGGTHPTIMTSYGGYGVPVTPQFSVFVALLIDLGCLFALPNIRGGSEFGSEWHEAAKRRKRQVAFDDFLAAGEWLIKTGRSQPQKLAMFGGSNSGLLVGAAMTQRPELFRAVVCMVPLLDMLRYHRFDNAHVWKEEFGTAEDPDDFAALFGYSPYHRVRDDTAYPATMLVSGDADQNCNPLHARKMTARLQFANTSPYPILLDYSKHRGHSPVLPLSQRIDALTDRMAFLCEQLQLTI